VTFSHVTQCYNVRVSCRRQTAEEREAERQAASRFMLSVHGGPTAAAAGSECDNEDKTSNLQSASHRDYICLNNASLHALQNLRPWADDCKILTPRPTDTDTAVDDENNDVVDDDDVVSYINSQCSLDLSPASPAAVSSAVLLQPSSRPVQLHQAYLTAA